MIDRNQQVTVFGGGGFIGRYVCEILLKAGVRLRVAERDPRRAWFLQPLGEVGQIAFATRRLWRARQASRAAVEGAGAVINLVGHPQGQSPRDPRRRRQGSRRSRARGRRSRLRPCLGDRRRSELRIRTMAGPRARARPRSAPLSPRRRSSARALVFGPEDQFTNRFAGMARLPFLPVIAPKTRFQPVYVRDLAAGDRGRGARSQRPTAARPTKSAGPQVMTMRELNARDRRRGRPVARPGRRARFRRRPACRGFGFLPGAPLTRDQWMMLQTDNVAAAKSRA